MATLTLGAGYNSIDWSLTGLTAAYADHMTAYLFRGSTPITNQNRNFSAVSYSGTFTGLAEGTTYTVRTVVYESGGGISSDQTKTITTLQREEPCTVTIKCYNIDTGAYLGSSHDVQFTVTQGATFKPFNYTEGQIVISGTTYNEYGDINGNKQAEYEALYSSSMTVYWYYKPQFGYCTITIKSYDWETGTYLGSVNDTSFTIQQGATYRPYSHTNSTATYGGMTYHEVGDINRDTDVTYVAPFSSTATIYWYYDPDVRYCTITIKCYDWNTGTYLGSANDKSISIQQGANYKPYDYTRGSATYDGVTYHEVGDINRNTNVTYTAPYTSTATIYWYYDPPVHYCTITIKCYDYNTAAYLGSENDISFTVQQGASYKPHDHARSSVTYGGISYHEVGDVDKRTDVTYIAPYTDTNEIDWYYDPDTRLKAPTGVITSSVTESNEITLLLTLTAALDTGSWGAVLSLNGISHDVYGSNESSGLASGSTLTTTFTNLTPNTTYFVILYNTDGVISIYGSYIGALRTLKEPISLFSYTANDGVNIATGKDPSNITAAKWNALGDKISEVSVRVGQGSVSHTTVYQGGRMTANVFNEANGHIGSLPGASGSPSNQQRGNRLLASLFIALKNALNAAITYANNYYR